MLHGEPQRSGRRCFPMAHDVRVDGHAVSKQGMRHGLVAGAGAHGEAVSVPSGAHLTGAAFTAYGARGPAGVALERATESGL